MSIEEMIIHLEEYDSDQELSIGYSNKGKICVRIHSRSICTPVVRTIYLTDMT